MVQRRRKKTELDDFTLEKLKIVERLGDIDNKLSNHFQRFEHHLEMDELFQKNLVKMVDSHEKMLVGTNGSDGMKIQLDRINQKEKWRTTMFGTMWTAIAGLVAAAVWNVLTKGTP